MKNQKNTLYRTSRIAECVGVAHPDKFCDQVSDAVQDALYDITVEKGGNPKLVRAAVETLAKADTVVIAGEISAAPEVIRDLDLDLLVKAIRRKVDYDARDDLKVINCLHRQAAEIASITGVSGAGDQGSMIGYATRETQNMMPLEYEYARQLILELKRLADDGVLPYLRYDTKSQVSLTAEDEVSSVIISAQHRSEVDLDKLRADIFEQVVVPIIGDINPENVKINALGSFVEGGSDADAGVTGRKIIVDAFGGSVPAGGGAFSGKDPTKVDRSAAYGARAIARDVLNHGFPEATTCQITFGYGIGQVQPEAVVATLDGGQDASEWVKSKFPDLSPQFFQERLGLWKRDGWSYLDTAALGHYGRPQFPWEHSIL